ncbi:MAG: MiaB/RimO family radical SAM methylthiotransferase, partial [Deltaproteobacteria bacterium]
VSRRSTDILAEVRKLAESGVQEVVLLGQNVNSYGLNANGEPNFAQLVRRVAAVDGIRRIRFTTSHPKDMSDDLIACFADVAKLCGHIHLPVQSGSDAILERMNRGYTRGEYLEKIRAIRRARPGISVTGDIIVGFPGETEADFEQTVSLVEDVRYSDLFLFVYSQRPGTKAAELPDELNREQKVARLEMLLEKQKQITRTINSSFLDTIQAVLVEGEGKRAGQVSGRMDNGRIVNFTGQTDLIGNFVDIRIVKAYQNSLLGGLI